MTKKASILVTMLMLSLFGCAKADMPIQKNDKATSQPISNKAPFKQRSEDAGKFLDLKHAGDAYQQQGKFEKALQTYKEALDKYAYSRPEQSISLDRIAMTYEAMGDLKSAAENYELSSEVTMNEDNRNILRSKASALRAKINTKY